MRIELIWKEIRVVPQIKINSSTEEIQSIMNMQDKYANVILSEEAKQVSTCTLCQLMGGNAKEFSYVQLNFNHRFRNCHQCLAHCHHCLALNIKILNCCGKIFGSNIQRGCKSKMSLHVALPKELPKITFLLQLQNCYYNAWIFSYSAQEHTPLMLLGWLLKRAKSNYCSLCQSFSE